LVVVEGDAVAETKLPKHRPLEVKALEDCDAALTFRGKI
jgi:hypothetical protein